MRHGPRRARHNPGAHSPGEKYERLDQTSPQGAAGSLEAVEGLVAREIERLGGIIEAAANAAQNPQWRREFEDLLRGCEYTFRGGQLVIFAPHPARAARIRLESDAIASAWQRLHQGDSKPSVVVRVEPARRSGSDR